MPRGTKRFGSRSSSSRTAFVEPDLVGLVVDREVRAVAEPRRLAAEDAAARGVEGQDPDRARDAAEHVLEALAHLARGLVRERDREDLLRLDPVRVDQVRDAVREHARLAGARARDDEQRPLGREHGLPLGRVQVGEIRLRRCDGQGAADASCAGRDTGRRRRSPPRHASASAKPSRGPVEWIALDGAGNRRP